MDSATRITAIHGRSATMVVVRASAGNVCRPTVVAVRKVITESVPAKAGVAIKTYATIRLQVLNQ